MVQIVNNRTAHSPGCPLDQYLVSPCPVQNRRETRLPQVRLPQVRTLQVRLPQVRLPQKGALRIAGVFVA
jgi:hypothetical protein